MSSIVLEGKETDLITKEILYCHRILRAESSMYSYAAWQTVFSEEEFGVETCCVPVDFAMGRETYNTIWERVKDKEIGVLGRYTMFTHNIQFKCLKIM